MSGPEIVLNGVTYRSAQEMPEDARAIWERYARKMEEQGIDWREQDRIAVAWTREGNDFRQHISFERRSENVSAAHQQNVDEFRRRIEALAMLKDVPKEAGAHKAIDAFIRNIGSSSTFNDKPAGSAGARRAIEDWRRSNEGSSSGDDMPGGSNGARVTIDVSQRSSKYSSTSKNDQPRATKTTRGSEDEWRRYSEDQSTSNDASGNVDDRRGISPVVVFLYVLCVVPLVFYGIPSNQPELLFAPNDAIYVSFLLLVLPCLWVALKDYRRRQPVRALGLLAAALPLIGFAAFNGVAKLLHSVERQPGAVTATVSELASKSGCDSLAFQDFRVLGDRICIESDLFDAVKVGDRIRVTGNLSRYGIEPDRLEPVSKESARFEDVE